MLWPFHTTAAIAVLSALLTPALLPGRPPSADDTTPEHAEPAPVAPGRRTHHPDPVRRLPAHGQPEPVP